MRFRKITIENFKNVVHGELSLENDRRPDGPSVLALYGQNGSGKSALVDCLLAFKLLALGEQLPLRFADYVNKSAAFARVVYEFDYHGGAPTEYEVEFRDNGGSPQLVSETVRLVDPATSRLRTVFTTKGYNQYGPDALRAAMTDDSMPAREERFDIGASLFFTLGVKYPDQSGCQWLADEICVCAEGELFVIGTREAEAIESGELTIAYDYVNDSPSYDPVEGPDVFEYAENHDVDGEPWKLSISTDSSAPSHLPESVCFALDLGWMRKINYIIGQLVPGMQLELAGVDEECDGMMPVYIQSRRGDVAIPLSCESRGVQKLVSVAWLLARVYNDPDFVAVIDEIDSGVFEYLLGEILRTVSEEGEGQLIFTSHNLRPLEVMDRGYIAFTTADPENRFIRLNDVDETQSLRDFYYRSIYLGDQEQSIYNAPSSADLSMAFMMAD